jgi:hypothetical protein
MNTFIRCTACMLLATIAPAALAKEPAVYPLALFPFAERGKEAKDLGPKVTDLLFAHLASDADLLLVDREDLKKVLDELELNQSGLVDTAKSARVGHLTGAKILVTGSIVQVDNTLYLIAKVIGTETSRVLGASVKGSVRDELDGLVRELGKQVSQAVHQRAAELVARPLQRSDRLTALKDQLGKGARPSVWIQVPERHVGQAASDPAAETELILFCRELGFTVIDRANGNKNAADVLISGEAASEFAARHGNLISVKGRLELKAVDPNTGQVLAIDRHTSVAVDLTEQLAGKTALQQAAAEVASRVLPKLIEPAKKKGDKK